MLEQIALALQKARIARGMTQIQLGKLVGVPQSHISKIEHGETDLQWTTLEHIANALGLSPILVPVSMVPLIENLKNASGGEADTAIVPLVGNLKEQEE